MLGRNIETIVDEIQLPGKYNYNWNAEGLSPGIYFCRLKVAGYHHTIKMTAR